MTPASLALFAAGWLIGRREQRGSADSARRPCTVTLRGTPDERRRPSDGVIAEASIVARLLRLRLLTLDAVVMVTPAAVTAPHARRGADVPASSAPAAVVHSPAPARPIGQRLAQAARTLDEGAATLAATRDAASVT